ARAVAGGGEATVEIGHEFMEVTRDVISHTVFGSSYRQGKEVFLAQRELQAMAFSSTYSLLRIPGMQYAPTRANLRRLQLNRKVRDMVMPIINDRLAAAKEGGGYGADLLGLMLEANAAGNGMSMDEIIDECKLQDFLLRRARQHRATYHLGHVPPRHPPRVAAAAAGGGGPRVWQRRHAPPPPG
ncbi:unnamed protein product, partial [Urochloa humidicola]